MEIKIDLSKARPLEVPTPVEPPAPLLVEGDVEITYVDEYHRNPNVSHEERQAYQKWCNATKNGFSTPEAKAAYQHWMDVKGWK